MKSSWTPKNERLPSPILLHRAMRSVIPPRAKRQKWPMEEEDAEEEEVERQPEAKQTTMPPSKASIPSTMGWMLMGEAEMRMMEACEAQAEAEVCLGT